MNFSHEKEALTIINTSQTMNCCMLSKSIKAKTQQQKIKSKNKERIDVIRKELKELSYKLSKSESKEIKKNLYQIENKKGLLE